MLELYKLYYDSKHLVVRNRKLNKNFSIFDQFIIIFNFLNPRLYPVIFYRLSAFFYHLRLVPIAKLFSLFNLIFFGIEISLKTTIGPGFIIAHSSGTVIGANKIGSNFIIFHQVTIGAKSFDGAGEESRPSIEDNVTIYTGAKIFGGVRIKAKTIIKSNEVIY